jgi:hypothetical protein
MTRNSIANSLENKLRQGIVFYNPLRGSVVGPSQIDGSTWSQFGTVSENTSGPIDRGVTVAGAASRVQTTSKTYLQFIADRATLIWYRPTDLTTLSFQQILGKGNASLSEREWLMYTSGTSLIIDRNGAAQSTTAVGTFVINQWHMVVSNYNHSSTTWTVWVYKAGSIQTTSIVGSFATARNDPLSIGAFADGAIHNTLSSFAEIMIWNRNLNSFERDLLWNGGRGLAYPFTNLEDRYPKSTNRSLTGDKRKIF